MILADNELQIPAFVKSKRKLLGLTQREFSSRVGVGLRFVRDLEQGKQSLRMDKVNEVLGYLGYELGPIPQRDRA